MGKENGQSRGQSTNANRKYAPSSSVIAKAQTDPYTDLRPWRPVPQWLDQNGIPDDLIVKSPVDENVHLIPQQLYTDANRQREGITTQHLIRRKKGETVKEEVSQATVDSIAEVLFEQPTPPPQIPPEEMITQQPSVVPKSQPATTSTQPVNHYGKRNQIFAAKNPNSRLRGPGSRSR